MASIYVPPVIGISTWTVAAADATARARSRAQVRCTGTDDQVKINDALDSGPVRLTEGTFNVSQSIAIPTKTRLSGEGKKTIIKAISTFAAASTGHTTNMIGTTYKAVVVTDAASSDIVIEDLDIDGNSVNQTEQGHCMAGLLVLDSDFAVIRNVTAHDVLRTGYDTDANTRQMCIALNQSAYAELWGCNCLRAGYEALGIRDDCSHITVHGGLCVVDDNASHAAQCYGAVDHAPSYNKFLGVRFRRDNFSVKSSGLIAHQANTMQALGCTFLNCTCTFNTALSGLVEGCHFFGWPSAILIVGPSSRIVVAHNSLLDTWNTIQFSGDGTTDIQVVDNMVSSLGYFIAFGTAGADVDNLRVEGNAIESDTTCFRLTGTTTKAQFRRNFIRGTVTNGFNLTGTNTGLIVEDNDVAGATTKVFTPGTFPAGAIVRNNVGITTRNSGTATVPNGATYIDVTHGLYATPTKVVVTPTLLSNAAKWWVTAIGATTFRINVDADPGAGTATFDWEARCLGD